MASILRPRGPRQIKVVVCGLSGKETPTDREKIGVGKSWLCSRLVIADHDHFVEVLTSSPTASGNAHKSCLTRQEFSSPWVGEDHFLYFGKTAISVPGSSSDSKDTDIDLHIVEHTEFLDTASDSLIPFKKYEAGDKPYAERAARTTLKPCTPPKRQYISSKYLAVSGTATASVTPSIFGATLPSSDFPRPFNVDVYALVYDVSLAGTRLYADQKAQLAEILRMLSEKRRVRNCVAVVTKCDKASQAGIDEALYDLRSIFSHVNLTKPIPIVTVSAKDNINIDLLREVFAKSALGSLRDSSSLTPYCEAVRAEVQGLAAAEKQLEELLLTEFKKGSLSTWQQFLYANKDHPFLEYLVRRCGLRYFQDDVGGKIRLLESRSKEGDIFGWMEFGSNVRPSLSRQVANKDNLRRSHSETGNGLRQVNSPSYPSPPPLSQSKTLPGRPTHDVLDTQGQTGYVQVNSKDFLRQASTDSSTSVFSETGTGDHSATSLPAKLVTSHHRPTSSSSSTPPTAGLLAAVIRNDDRPSNKPPLPHRPSQTKTDVGKVMDSPTRAQGNNRPNAVCPTCGAAQTKPVQSPDKPTTATRRALRSMIGLFNTPVDMPTPPPLAGEDPLTHDVLPTSPPLPPPRQRKQQQQRQELQRKSKTPPPLPGEESREIEFHCEHLDARSISEPSSDAPFVVITKMGDPKPDVPVRRAEEPYEVRQFPAHGLRYPGTVAPQDSDPTIDPYDHPDASAARITEDPASSFPSRLGGLLSSEGTIDAGNLPIGDAQMIAIKALGSMVSDASRVSVVSQDIDALLARGNLSLTDMLAHTSTDSRGYIPHNCIPYAVRPVSSSISECGEAGDYVATSAVQ